MIILKTNVKPKLLDLFCGGGGAAKGYQLAGFYVVGIDNRPQPHYCGDEFYQSDAFDYLATHHKEFDGFHASSPCQEYSQSRYLRNHMAMLRGVNPKVRNKLLPEVRKALINTCKPWVNENVEHAPMPAAIVLCGTMFGLPLLRHRAFETSFMVFVPGICNHPEGFYSVIGGHVRGHGSFDSGKTYVDSKGTIRRRERMARKQDGIDAMGINWLTLKEMSEAIPPAYTEYIGKQFINVV